VNEASDQLNDLVTAVRDTGRAGSMTITIDVKPQSKGDVSVLSIGDKITTKMPKVEHGETIMFASADGTLTRNDPRQIEMAGLKVVETGGTAPLRQVAG
jgi:isopentenyl phosphate kinase